MIVMTQEQARHLEACGPCRRLHREWLELFRRDEDEPPGPAVAVRDRSGEWEEGRPLNVTGKAPPDKPPRGGGGEPPPQHRCPGCGGWKPTHYATCFPCSGLVKCESCGENYHDSQYDECYECHTGEEYEE